MNNTIKHAAGHAALTILYIAGVATFMSHAQSLFGTDSGDPKTVLVPIMMITLFVLSAAITGTLVLGRPALLYIDGQKREALVMFGYTIGFLFIGFVIAAVLLYLSVR